MAIRTYKVILDSKNSIAPEPVFLRQGDKTGAVVIDATLMDNGTPVSLSGLTPMFKANTADGQAVIADSTGFNIVNASSGKFTYQVPNALSSVPGKIKVAYFSFLDSSGAQSTFNVVFFVEKAADMTQENAKDWVSNLNEIIDRYNQWVNNAHSSWADFVNENKEIIESIDPGGKVLSELIGFRHSDMLSKTFDTAKLRGDFFDSDLRDRGVNVKWFGAKGDGTNNDTAAFEAAYLASKNIYIPAGAYYLTGFHVPVGTKITGDNAILELHSGDKTGSNNILAGSKSNSIITGLKIHSLEENLEWNRFDISSQDHIIIRNCEFTGFRHVSNAPNAWGIYLEESKQISIENCRFDNNSQSDIAILDGCENIQINDCSGINDTFYINFEPNNVVDPIKRVSINNCVLSKLSLRNYYLTNQNFKQISVTSSVIDHLDYYGADVEFISSKINYVDNSLSVSKPTDKSTISSGGVLKLNGALNLSSNLVIDPTMDSYATVAGSNANWISYQGTLNASTGTTRYEDQFGALTRIGTKTTNSAQLLFMPKLLLTSANNNVANCYKVATGDQFLATITGWAHYDTAARWISTNAAADFYDNSGNLISQVHLSLCKSQAGTDSPYNKYSAFINVPDNVTGMRLKVGECTVAASISALYFGAFSLQKILTAADSSNGDINLYQLPVGSRRRFKSATCPSSNYGWCNYQEGDICYNSIPTKGQPYGWICINQGYPGDWLPLGVI